MEFNVAVDKMVEQSPKPMKTRKYSPHQYCWAPFRTVSHRFEFGFRNPSTTILFHNFLYWAERQKKKKKKKKKKREREKKDKIKKLKK